MKFLSTALEIDSGWISLFIMLGVAIACGLAGIVWAVYFRKGHGHKHHRRRRRGDSRAMSPTLAETGGLPPIRKSKDFSDQLKP